MKYIYPYASPLGGITLASDGEKLIGLWFDGQKYFADTLEPKAVAESTKSIKERLPIFEETIRWLDTYFRGAIPDFTPPLTIQSSPFREEVWKILLTIPYGQTMTYGQIADILAKRRGLPRMSAQAVGGAVGHNPISLIIPCHRVIGAKGNLTGYAGGIDKKIQLLTLEKIDTTKLFLPKKSAGPQKHI